MKRSMRILSLSIFILGAAIAATPADLFAGLCKSGDGLSSCSCSGRCWADENTCGCLAN